MQVPACDGVWAIPTRYRSRLVNDTARKLLIVEDDPGLQSQLKWCFEDYEVLAATNRAGAISELRRHQPAVVLQDLGLPPDADGPSEGLATLQAVLSAVGRTGAEIRADHRAAVSVA